MTLWRSGETGAILQIASSCASDMSVTVLSLRHLCTAASLVPHSHTAVEFSTPEINRALQSIRKRLLPKNYCIAELTLLQMYCTINKSSVTLDGAKIAVDTLFLAETYMPSRKRQFVGHCNADCKGRQTSLNVIDHFFFQMRACSQDVLLGASSIKSAAIALEARKICTCRTPRSCSHGAQHCLHAY